MYSASEKARTHLGNSDPQILKLVLCGVLIVGYPINDLGSKGGMKLFDGYGLVFVVWGNGG